MNVPHAFRQVAGAWQLVPVPTCPWCGGDNEPRKVMFGRCNNSWHRSHPEHLSSGWYFLSEESS